MCAPAVTRHPQHAAGERILHAMESHKSFSENDDICMGDVIYTENMAIFFGCLTCVCRYFKTKTKHLIAMPNSVQKKLSNMFSRASLSEKGNSVTKITSKGIQKRFSMGSPVVAKENGAVMGGGDQEAMLTFIEQQGNQISQLKEHIASLEAKLLASPPGYSVKPAALLFSPIRGAQSLSGMKSPQKCISVSQAVHVPQASSSPLSVVVSPTKNFVSATAATVTESSPMAAVQVIHYSQLSLDSTFSTANGSAMAGKETIPFQEFVDSCLSENVMSPTARPLLASFVCGDASGIQEHGYCEEVAATNIVASSKVVDLEIASLPTHTPNRQQKIGDWICNSVSFSLQQYWIHSESATIELCEQMPQNATKSVGDSKFLSNGVHHSAKAVVVPNISLMEDAVFLREHHDIHTYGVQKREATAQPCQNESAVHVQHETREKLDENLVSPCAARTFHASPSLDAAAANHVQSKVSPGFCVVSPIADAACSNQASGNESAEFPNHTVINGLVFSGIARLPEYVLQRIKHSRADFQLVNGVAWVPDCLADSCMLCEEEFSLFFRRHHCRSCGIVICSGCSEWNKDKRCCSLCMSASQTPSRQNRASHQVYYA